jgi:hypothetical protein
MTDFMEQGEIWNESFIGANFLFFKNLPAGEYTIQARKFKESPRTGEFAFSVVTMGTDADVTFA